MRKNTRDTIRRPKDYERDPSWDSDAPEIFSEESASEKRKAKKTNENHDNQEERDF